MPVRSDRRSAGALEVPEWCWRRCGARAIPLSGLSPCCSECCCCVACFSPSPLLGVCADSCGHHPAHRAPELGSGEERLCPRECITTHVLVRDLHLGAPEATGARRLEVVADGLPLFGGAQLAVDTTLVSALHCDGSARAGAVARNRPTPELVAPWSRCRLVVIANEVGGRWSPEALAFLRQLAKAKARNEPPLMQRRAQQARKMRWLAIMSRVSSLLELRGHGCAEGVVP